MLMSFNERKESQTKSNTLNMNTYEMCCTTVARPVAKELFYVPQPSFIIPIFRAPTTTSTLRSTTKTSTYKIITAILKQEQKQDDNTNILSSNMISQRIFENLILTNTIVAAFCIVLMITLTGFLIFLLLPSIRRRWLNEKPKDEKKLEDLSTLSRQPSFQHFTLGPSRLNPLFESTTGTTTQFGQLFHPHTTTATLLHPTIWTSMSPTPHFSSPLPVQQTHISSQAPTSTTTKPTTTTTTSGAAASRPPLPSHPPTTVQRSPRKR
jgi:hypothetical protein